MGIQGTGLSQKNVRLRFFGIVFMGIIAFGAVLYWRQAALSNADYVEFDIPRKEKMKDSATMRSERYMLDVEESSPSVK